MADAIADFSALEEQPTPETVETPEASTPETPEQQPAEGGEQQPTDGRKGPLSLRSAIKAASEALPEHAELFKKVSGAFFREQEYQKSFPSPQEASDAKSLIDTVGGIEGISRMQQRDQMYAQQDAFLKEGNPDVLEDFADDFPDGFATLAPHYLSLLSQKNPEAFNNAVVPYAVGMLDNAGFSDFLQNLYAEQDPGRKNQMVQQMYNWFQKAQQGAQNLKTPQAKTTPKADDGRAALQAEREQIFQEGVAAKVNSSVAAPLDTAVQQYGKAYGLSDKQQAHLRQAISNRMVEQMNADQNYKKQVDLRRNNPQRSHDSVASYIAGEFNRRLKDTAYEVAQEIYGAPKNGAVKPNGTGVARPGQPQTASNGRALLVQSQPNTADIDWSKDPHQHLFITNQAWLKNGRFVKWN